MYNIAITTKILQINYLYDSYINFQFELDMHVFLYERALTRYLEIATIDSLSVEDIIRIKSISVIKFVFHSNLK